MINSKTAQFSLGEFCWGCNKSIKFWVEGHLWCFDRFSKNHLRSKNLKCTRFVWFPKRRFNCSPQRIFFSTRQETFIEKRGKKTKQETNKQYAIRTVADTSALDLILHIGKDSFKSNHLLVTFGITMDSRYEKKII